MPSIQIGQGPIMPGEIQAHSHAQHLQHILKPLMLPPGWDCSHQSPPNGENAFSTYFLMQRKPLVEEFGLHRQMSFL